MIINDKQIVIFFQLKFKPTTKIKIVLKLETLFTKSNCIYGNTKGRGKIIESPIYTEIVKSQIVF